MSKGAVQGPLEPPRSEPLGCLRLGDRLVDPPRVSPRFGPTEGRHRAKTWPVGLE